MKMWRRIVFLGMALVACMGMFAAFMPQQASAKNPPDCWLSPIAFGRARWCGYFYNAGPDTGSSVRDGEPAVPANVNTAQEFIDLVIGDLHSGNKKRITGAQFIIQTMRQRAPGAPKSVTEGFSTSELEDWKRRVQALASTHENGVTSTGPGGSINWKVSETMWCGAVNTYYQGSSRDDVAPYLTSDANTYDACYTGEWYDDAWPEQFIIFRDANGNEIYRIRRLCMNPFGTGAGLPQPQPAYDLRPSITAQLAGGGDASTGVEVGQTVEFRYSILNQGAGASPTDTSCTAYTNVHNGYVTARSNPTAGGGAGPPTGCPRSFPGNNTNTPLGGTESVVATVDNQTICRSLLVSPASGTIASRGFEVCVQVAAKPFVSVRGGDISAGGGVETLANCNTTNNVAAIIGWNKGVSGSYQGAGVQFAAFALSTILDVASSQGNGAGAAAVPTGLSFANTDTTPPAGRFGGSFGSVPCITDHYGTLPATYSTIGSASVSAALSSGVHFRSGDLTLTSGAIERGRRISVYVNGDVYISGPITYSGSGTWGSKDVPLFRLVVQGDIYIAPGVSQLDGLYVAQSQNGTTGGVIHTCATGLRAPVNLVSLAGSCGTQLVVNGSFTARQVRLMRTHDSLRTGNPAEVFNYSPALWIAQPTDISTGVEWYDSITSLPPVL